MLDGVDHSTLLWLLIGLNSVLALGPALIDWLRGRLDLFNCRHVFLLFLWFTYAVWPAWVLLAGYESFDSIAITLVDQNSGFVPGALGLGALGLMCFHLGYYFAPKTFLNANRQLAKALSQFPSGAMRLAIPVYSLVGLLSAFLFIRSAGGLDYLKYIDEFRTTRLAGHGPLLMGLGFLVVAATLAHHRAITQRRSLNRWLNAVTLGLLASLATLMCASRHLFLLFVFSAVIAHHYRVRRFRISPRLFAWMFAFVVINWLYSDFRAANYAAPPAASWTDTAWRGFFKRFVGLESLVRIRAVFSEGETHLGVRPLAQDAVFSLVPRMLYPEKPPVLGWIGNVKFYSDVFEESAASTGSVPLGIVGDLFWIAGVPGVVIGFLLLGLGARATYQLATTHVHSPLGLLIYSNLYIFFLFVAEDLKLHLVFTMHRLVFLIFPLGVLLLASRPFRQRSDRRESKADIQPLKKRLPAGDR